MSVSLEQIMQEYAEDCERQAGRWRKLAEVVGAEKAAQPSPEASAGSLREGQMLTTPEVAAMLRVSRKMLTTWRGAGLGPRWSKVGRLVRYQLADVLEWQGRGGARGDGGQVTGNGKGEG